MNTKHMQYGVLAVLVLSIIIVIIGRFKPEHRPAPDPAAFERALSGVEWGGPVRQQTAPANQWPNNGPKRDRTTHYDRDGRVTGYDEK